MESIPTPLDGTGEGAKKRDYKRVSEFPPPGGRNRTERTGGGGGERGDSTLFFFLGKKTHRGHSRK